MKGITFVISDKCVAASRGHRSDRQIGNLRFLYPLDTGSPLLTQSEDHWLSAAAYSHTATRYPPFPLVLRQLSPTPRTSARDGMQFWLCPRNRSGNLANPAWKLLLIPRQLYAPWPLAEQSRFPHHGWPTVALAAVADCSV